MAPSRPAREQRGRRTRDALSQPSRAGPSARTHSDRLRRPPPGRPWATVLVPPSCAVTGPLSRQEALEPWPPVVVGGTHSEGLSCQASRGTGGPGREGSPFAAHPAPGPWDVPGSWSHTVRGHGASGGERLKPNTDFSSSAINPPPGDPNGQVTSLFPSVTWQRKSRLGGCCWSWSRPQPRSPAIAHAAPPLPDVLTTCREPTKSSVALYWIRQVRELQVGAVGVRVARGAVSLLSRRR